MPCLLTPSAAPKFILGTRVEIPATWTWRRRSKPEASGESVKKKHRERKTRGTSHTSPALKNPPKNYPSFGFFHELTLVTGESSQRLHRCQILSATGAIFFFFLLRLSGPCDITHDVRANRSASFRASLQLRATSELKLFILL